MDSFACHKLRVLVRLLIKLYYKATIVNGEFITAVTSKELLKKIKLIVEKKILISNLLQYREYKSPKHICATCPFLAQCTESKDHQKVVTRHIWQEYVEEAEHLRHHKDLKPIYAKRKETIERVFADAKEKHGMRWTTLRDSKN